MTKKFVKGDRVLVHATVRSGYQQKNYTQMIFEPPQERPRDLKRSLVRNAIVDPCQAMVTGYSYRVTGIMISDNYSGSSGRLAFTKHHPVTMVQPIYSRRWLRPWACLAEDLELITDKEQQK